MGWFRRKSLPVPGTTAFFVNGVSSVSSRTLKVYAEEGYAQNPIVNFCINKIAEACAVPALEVHTNTASGKKVATSHPVLDLLKRPNPTQTWEDFIKEMASWHRIAGEVFVLRLPDKGPAKELYCMNPEAMGIKKNSNGSAIPLAYTYGFGGDMKTYPVNIIDGSSQILHIKTFNPADPFRGLPPLKAIARATDTHNHGAAWNSNLLLNSAKPSGVITMDGTPDATVLSQMKEGIKKLWEGAKNAGNVAMLTAGAKFTQLSLSPKDMDFKDSMNAAAKDIALVFGVPLPLVTMEAATFSNMEQAEESFWVDTVMPLLNVLIGNLSNFLMPLYPRRSTNEEICFNYDSVPALEDRRERLFDRMTKGVSSGVLTPNEARAEMGFDEMSGNADKLMVTGIVQLVDNLGKQPTTQQEPPPVD